MRLLWGAILVILLCVAAYLFYTLLPSREALPDFPPSTDIRILLQRSVGEITLQTRSDGYKIVIPGAERPVLKRGGTLQVRRENGRFVFAGIQYDSRWVDIIPNDQYFYINTGEYPGRVRLIPEKNPAAMSVVNILPLEPYIARVLDGEMKGSWPIETLKAQAIIARTFAMWHINDRKRRDWDLFGTSKSQAYRNRPPNQRSIEAVLDTQNILLEYQGSPFPTYYINTCGGNTVSVALVNKYTKPIPPLQGVSCSYCKASPHFNWRHDIPASVLLPLVAKEKAARRSLRDLSTGQRVGPRTISMLLTLDNGTVLEAPAQAFRLALNQQAGREVLKSYNFRARLENGTCIIEGQGWGHIGLGMCQYGAKSMGEQHFTCAEILAYYYPSSTLSHYLWD